MRYPEDRNEIVDPSLRLLPELARKIAPIIPRTVAQFRAATQRPTLEAEEVLSAAADEIFGIIAPRRLRQTHADVEALRASIREDIDTSVAFIFYIFKLAGLGRMPFVWHNRIEKQLQMSKETHDIETRWWELQADANPGIPAVPPPVPTKAPRTDTALRIEAFIHTVETETGERILKKDIWLVAGYTSDKEFRAFQAEKPTLSAGIARKFNTVLKMSPREFCEKRRECRKKLEANR